jgi:putative ABC transport system permease protein
MPTRDLSLAVRSLWKDKPFTFAAFFTLASCIAANTVLFSIVNSVLLKPLPVPEASRLVYLHNTYPGAGVERGRSGVPDYFDRVAGMQTLESLALYDTRSRSTGGAGRPERVVAMEVTPSFFRVARVAPAFGRTFAESEGEPGRDDKVILSHAYWQERYAGDPKVIGRELRLDGKPYTVVGVMGKDFVFMEPEARLWTPLAFTPEQRSDEARHNNSWASIGRLRDGATIAQAQNQVDAINAATLDRVPAMKPVLVNARYRTRIEPLKDMLVRDVRGRLYFLWGGTLLVLLIGCVNVLNLVLVRSRARLRDLATRLAIGASRGAIARQFFAESFMLTIGSGACGLLVGWGGLRLLGSLDLAQIPRGAEIRLDAIAVAFTMGLACVLGLVLGAVPLASAFGANLSAVLHEGGRSDTGGRTALLVRRSLVVTQVAVAFLLLIGTGLLVSSFRQILAIDPGFDTKHVLTAHVRLPSARYPSGREMVLFSTEALRRLRAMAGVDRAGVTSAVPLSGDHSDSVILAEDYQQKPGESVVSPARLEVSAGYFETMGIRLVRGRYFEDRDAYDSQRVIIVDERLARRFWPGQDPVGRRMYRPGSLEETFAPGPKTNWLTVVGVVAEVKQDGLVASRTPVGAYYLPLTQEPIRSLAFVVRTPGDPQALVGSLRATIAGLDAELPVFATKTMEKVTDESLVTRRWPMLLSMAFGAVALMLSALGIYGVLSYLVSQRTREIGIRMALGSTPRGVFDLVLREGLVLFAIGLVGGGIGLAGLRRILETQLYGVGPADPGVAAVATFVLGVVALVACAVPARRATRIDPVVALNTE